MVNFDVQEIRKKFPILEKKINGHPLIYFDSAATTLKPREVVDRMSQHYLYETSNVHRGIHTLSSQATTMYEASRSNIKSFINASDDAEIIFTKGTTESINIAAKSFTSAFMKEGDEILVTEMEHHSDFVPWQMICEAKGFHLKVITLSSDGSLDLKKFERAITENTKIIAFTMVSNTLGVVNPVKEIVRMAHTKGAKVLLDGAQAIAHQKVDVQALDCDFLVFSGHKMFGPTGIGVLYGKSTLLSQMPPVFGGGAMIKSVTLEKTEYEDAPLRFEPGTPHIAGAIGLSSAIDFIKSVGIENIEKHEHEITEYALENLAKIADLKIIGTARPHSSIISFVVEGVHSHDLGSLLDQYGIAVRTGHHCTQPIMKRFEISSSVRLSLSIYNTREEIDFFIVALKKALTILKG